MKLHHALLHSTVRTILALRTYKGKSTDGGFPSADVALEQMLCGISLKEIQKFSSIAALEEVATECTVTSI